MNHVLRYETLHVHEESFKSIYYLKNYPTMHVKYLDEEIENYRYINGLKLSSPQFFESEEKYNATYQHFTESGGLPQYLADLAAIFNLDILEKIIITSVPSSKVGKQNMVSNLVDLLSRMQPNNFINGNSLFTKIENEEASHESSGTYARDYLNHYNSWSRNPPYFDRNHPIVVIDDVLTTGSTFYAANKHLQELGYSKIINFAFGKSIPNVLLRGNSEEKNRDNIPVDGIIFDIDQTIIDTHRLQQLKFEDKEIYTYKRMRQLYEEGYLHLYEGITKLFEDILWTKKIPIMFVTNRSRSVAHFLIEKNSKDLFNYNFKKPLKEGTGPIDTYIPLLDDKKQIIVHSSPNGSVTEDNRNYVKNTIPILLAYQDADTYTDNRGKIQYAYKPHVNLIAKAKNEISTLLGKENPRIIGVGNTEYDIMAYNKEGVESILVHWGNRSNIRNSFQADHVFWEVEQFRSFLENN